MQHHPNVTISPHPLPMPSALDGEGLILTVPAQPENVAVVRRQVAAFARNAGLDEDGVADVALALSEACANVVVHAYRAAAGAAVLKVRAMCEPDQLAVVVADHGLGMVPRTDSPGLGLGLPLMASLTSTLELRETEGGGTEVWMTFDRRRRTAPVPDPIPLNRTA